MSLAGRLLGLRAATPDPQVKPPSAATGTVGYMTPGMPQTPKWDASNAISVGYYANIYSYRCARTIATTIAGLPFRAGRNPDSPGSYDPAAPLARLLGPPPGGPAPGISPRALWIWSIVSRLVTGRYAWETVQAPGQARIVSLWPLVASRLEPYPTDGGTRLFSGFDYRLNNQTRPLRPDQVFYSWRPSQEDWREPESVLQAASLPLSAAVALDRYMTAFLRNNMVGSKLVVTPGFEDLEMRRAFQDQFIADMTGYDNAGRTGFAEFDDSDGKTANVQVVDLASNMVDAQMVDTQKWLRDVICDAYGVPVSIIGQASERTYENSDQEHRNYWSGTILPLIHEIVDDVNMNLAPRLGVEVGWFDLGRVEALQPSHRFAPAATTDLVAAGIVTVGEVREDMALPPVLPKDVNAPLAEAEPMVEDTPGAGTGGSGLGGGGRSQQPLEAFADLLAGQLPDSGERYDVAPIGLGKNWVTSVGGLPLFARAVAHALIRNGHSESNAIQMAIGVLKNWASGEGHVTAKTRAKAAAAIAEWEAKKLAAHATPNKRDALTEGSSAGALLPKVGAPMLAMRQQAHLPVPGGERGKCLCGLPVKHPIHLTAIGASRRAGQRHAGPGHLRVPTGHATARRRATLAQVHGQGDTLEPAVQAAMDTLFAEQEKATLDRLAGRRGKQMLRAATPPEGDEPAPLIDASQVYDLAHWTTRTRQALTPAMAAVSGVVGDRLRTQFGQLPESLAGVQDALAARAQRLADTVSRTTLDQLVRALQEGVANRETMTQLTARVRRVFTDARSTRAPMIARTETIGALNTAADTYAQSLPSDVVAGKEWLSAHDTRVRHAHHEADGQVRAVGVPFLVGGFPMQHPGDVAAPPDLTVNCRCVTGYLTPAEYALHTRRPASVAA